MPPALPPDADALALLRRLPVAEAARAILGWTLTLDGVGGRIVETEAYDALDPASHSFGGPTARNAAMWGPPACAYVYRIYGLHWCLNLVAGPQPGAAILVRALEPTHGLDRMHERRQAPEPRRLCAGPGRLCQALGVTGAHDGLPLDRPPFALEPGPPPPAVSVGPRIGITKAADMPWRFGWAGSPFLSRSFPADATLSARRRRAHA